MNKVRAFSFVFFSVVLILIVATVVEHFCGTDFVYDRIYTSNWFAVLLFFSSLFGAYVCHSAGLLKSLPRILLVLSFLLILLGGWLTHTFGVSGNVHILSSDSTSVFVDGDGVERRLPFVMSLDSFCVRNYPQTDTPSDFISYIKIDGQNHVVSMNRYLSYAGYRFCQSSFDDNGIGSWLSLSKDFWGYLITVAGYVLFLLSFLVVVFKPKSRFRQLLHEFQSGSTALTLILLVFCGNLFPQNTDSLSATGSSYCGESDKRVYLSLGDAEKLSRKLVIYNDRVVPFNTVAVDFMRKVHGNILYRGLIAEQVVGGWMLAPQAWRKDKFIKVKDASLLAQLKLDGPYVSLADLFDEGGHYKLQKLLSACADDKKMQKSIREVDEKVGIILMLSNNKLFSDAPNCKHLVSEQRISAEILYNRAPLTKIIFMLNLTVGLFSLLFCLLCLRSSVSKGSSTSVAFRLFLFMMAISVGLQAFTFGLRWYVSDHIPLANGYETMMFLSLIVSLFSILCYKWIRFFIPFGFIASGLISLVSFLGQMNPQITQLVPVLNSPWLSLHVSFVMIAYSLFMFTFLTSTVCLLMMCANNEAYRQEVCRLTTVCKLLLYPSVFFMGLGIILGAVWAYESWGAYWSWDPKEVWALISFMIYAAPLMDSLFKFYDNKKIFHIYISFSFAAVIMTYFGVNYILGGMHSYAG